MDRLTGVVEKCIFRERFPDSGALKEKIPIIMVAQAHHQNGGAGEQDCSLLAHKSVKHQRLARLSAEEDSLLQSCENVIAKHLAAFFEVGEALMKIRDGKLYRAEFKTFEEYCRKRWGMGRFNAYRQTQAAGVMKNLLTMVNTPLPESERQVRPLVGLKPEAAEQVWKTAVDQAAGTKVTGKLVEKVTKELATKKSGPSKIQRRESWQDLVEPLLKDALRQTQVGNRSAVEELLFKVTLRLQVGQRENVER
jgi:hypothetical protein